MFMTGSVFSGYQEMAKNAGKAWYRSKETVPIQDPFVGGGFLSNKKWPLIEESNSLKPVTAGNFNFKGNFESKLTFILKFPTENNLNNYLLL